MPELPWVGSHVRVNADRSVEWVRCAVCHRVLRTPESRRAGVGPTCAEITPPGVVARALEQAREADRARWRRGHSSWPDPADAAGFPPEEERRVFVIEGTPDHEERWRVFCRAMGRPEGP
jgi:hypothetical protein